jgi:phosphate-selective porin OprO/OprP
VSIQGIVAILLVAASPLGAQTPSVSVGDWLRVDFRARFQGDIRRSDAPMADEADFGDLDFARRRVGVEGQVFRVIDYQFEYELGVGEWRDVYLNYRHSKALQVRGGAFKVPFGLEENTSSTNLDFVYRSRISSRLAPGRDQGVTVHGKTLRGFLSYEAGAFRNDGDNARPSQTMRVYGGRTMALRVVAYPFTRVKSHIGELRVGAALSGTNLPLGFPPVRARTVFGASFFESDVWVKGRRQRAGLEARWRTKRLTLQSEYIRLADQRNGQGVGDVDLPPLIAQGWYVSGTYRLTGRRRWYGDVEAAGRLERLEFGSGGSDGEKSISARAESVLGNADRAATLGVNWHLNQWVKVQLNVIRESLHNPSMGPLPDRPVFWSRVLRLQLTL